MFVHWLLSGNATGTGAGSTLAEASTYLFVAAPGLLLLFGGGGLRTAVPVTAAWYGLLLGIAAALDALLGL
jgi:hypothetical protein